LGFRENGPLSTFGARISLAYALNEFGPKTLDNLKTVNELRNAFAHSAQPIDFNFEPVVTLCNSIQIAPNDFVTTDLNNPRERFVNFVALILVQLTFTAELKGTGLTFQRAPLP
jgi:hypothetical protein